jgi:hypothetical protein
MVSQHLYSFWILDLFHKFHLIQILVVYETSPIRNIISLSFQRVQEHPDWMLYATWASILRSTSPGFRIGLELNSELDLWDDSSM